MIGIKVNTKSHSQALDITAKVRQAVMDSKVSEGWVEVYVPHTTAGITVNEAADPDVMRDVLAHLDKMVPWKAGYRHAEGNSAAHIKSILVGNSLRLPCWAGSPKLGRWQGIFFMEFDGPRSREVWVEVLPLVKPERELH